MFYCENCANSIVKKAHKCFNAHNFYTGPLCTCKCNWEKLQNEI